MQIIDAAERHSFPRAVFGPSPKHDVMIWSGDYGVFFLLTWDLTFTSCCFGLSNPDATGSFLAFGSFFFSSRFFFPLLDIPLAVSSYNLRSHLLGKR